MSKELEKLEKIATEVCIRDIVRIEGIMKYLLSLPFSRFEPDKSPCLWIRGEIMRGFYLDAPEELSEATFQDILTLIRHMPENDYFDLPDAQTKRVGKSFNSAGSCYALSRCLEILARKDIRVKEFMHIEVRAFADYLCRKGADEYGIGKMPGWLYHKIRSSAEMIENKAKEHNNRTIGDLIERIVANCHKIWVCPVDPLNDFSSTVMDHYELARALFMDCIQKPFIHGESERVKKIMERYYCAGI